MKIYYIANARMPTEKAHGIQIAKMCEAFIEEGIDLELIIPNRKKEGKSIQEFYGLRVPIRCVKLPIVDLYGAGRVGFFISSCIYALGYFFYLLRKKISGKSGIIYTIDVDQFSFFLVPFLGMPYFAEIHDAKKKSWPFSLLFKRINGVVAINLTIQSKLISTFAIAKEKTRAWSNAVDLSMFKQNEDKISARQKLGLPHDKKIAMYVGKIYSWKGLDILVKAAEKAQDIFFYLVGGTEDELRYIGAVKELPQNLICVGQQPFSEIPHWLWAADVLMVLGTSRNEYSYLHTSPMKLFEYLASHRPIVASKTPAIEQIVSGNEVLFCNPDDSSDLIKKIRYLCDNAEEAKKYADNAFKKVDTVFEWNQRAKWILNFITKCI